MLGEALRKSAILVRKAQAAGVQHLGPFPVPHPLDEAVRVQHGAALAFVGGYSGPAGVWAGAAPDLPRAQLLGHALAARCLTLPQEGGRGHGLPEDTPHGND
eukprot:scaffold25361_cov79-Isochrysis_galbana.AAC.1